MDSARQDDSTPLACGSLRASLALAARRPTLESAS